MDIARRFGVPASIAVSIIAIACGGGDDEPAPTPEPTAPAVAPGPTATPFSATPATSVPAATPTRVPAAPVPTSSPTPSPSPTAIPSAFGSIFFLERVEPAEPELFTDASTLEIVGRTRVDAVITVNDDVVEPDADGMFRHTVALEIGVNVIEVVASIASDEQDSFIVTAVYLP